MIGTAQSILMPSSDLTTPPVEPSSPSIRLRFGQQPRTSVKGKQHILYGDAPGSGGHLWPGAPGKTPFPQNWSANRVVHEVGDIVTAPGTKWYYQTGTGGKLTKAGDPAKWVAWETRDGVLVRVVYEPATGRVVTAFPETNPIPASILNQKVP